MQKFEVVTELRLRREAAERPLRKLLVAQLQLRCSKPTSLNEKRLFEWELREHEPCELHANALCAYFRTLSVAELGLGHSEAAAYYWTWATKAERKAEVHRRKLLEKGVKVAGPALLPVGPLTALAQRLGGRPSLDLADVQAAEHVATHLASAYLAAPNAETVRAAVAHVRTLADRLTLDSLSPEVRARLAAVACDAASLAGYATLHAGRRAEARSWFDDSIVLAHEAGDPRLEALALGARASTLSARPMPGFGQGDRRDSLAARQASSMLDRHLPAHGRAYVNGLLALELAVAGDDAGSGRALERAVAAAARIGREEPGWGWWSQHAELSAWDSARAGMYTGARALFLGRHRDAVPLLEGALTDTTVPIRRAYAHLDLTQAWQGLGDPDRVSAAGIAALDQAPELDLKSVEDELRLIRMGLPEEWNDLGCMHEFDERLGLAWPLFSRDSRLCCPKRL